MLGGKWVPVLRGAMGVSYMAQTRDWISETVNHPDHAVKAHNLHLTVCVIRGCQGCIHAKVAVRSS